MKHFINPELGISAHHVAFERWLGRVEDALWDTNGQGVVDSQGLPLLTSSETIDAFENGISAGDYALQVQAVTA